MGRGTVSDWAGINGDIGRAVERQRRQVLETYRADDKRIEQDANLERSISDGAYARRQVFELMQNAADAMRGSTAGRCEVILSESALYVANTGGPLTVEGVDALMATHISNKRNDEIGRFGLGFKSVLAVSDAPMILSRSGSLRFDRRESQSVLERDFPGRDHYPAARLAWAVDPDEQRKSDSVLNSLMKWATTVVLLPLRSESRATVAKSLQTFPAEFCLFSPHVSRVELDDLSKGDAPRLITLAENEDATFSLTDGKRRSIWVVGTRRHMPSPEALADGGYQAARESIDVTWAAPLEGVPLGVGSLWAYFPTTSLTSLSGIVNAPWRLADDRESLLAGDFNKEILTRVLPALVVETLPKLNRPSRPAAPIDVLPARGREVRSWADRELNEPVTTAVANAASIPSIDGTLRHPKRVRLHPDGLEPDMLALWETACPDPEWWVHHSINSNERRSKVKRLMAKHERREVGYREWLERLMGNPPTIEQSGAAVRLVADLAGKQPEVKEARVLLLDDASLHRCRRGEVFMPGGPREPGRHFIDPVLSADLDVRKSLADLGIKVLDDSGSLRGELVAQDIQWERVWPAARRAGRGEAERVFREVFGADLLERLRVRVRSGQWKRPRRALLPGVVIPAGGGRDSEHVVDDRYHRQDLELLSALGLADQPRPVSGAPQEAWSRVAEEELRDLLRRKVQQPRLPDESITIDRGRVLWPLDLLAELSPDGQLAMTHSSLRHLAGDEEWKLVVRSSGKSHRVDDPTFRYLMRYGALHTPVGPQPVRRCLAYDETYAAVDGVVQPLPVAPAELGTLQAEKLHLKRDPSELSASDWEALIGPASGWEPKRRALVYAWAAYCEHPAPAKLRAVKGSGQADLPPAEVAVTGDDAVWRRLVKVGMPALFADENDAEVLRERWGLADGAGVLVETVDHEDAGEAYLAVDRFPPLRNRLEPEDHDIEVLPCRRLELMTASPAGQVAEALTEHRDGRRILTTATEDRDVLLAISRALGVPIRADLILAQMDEQRRDRRRRDIAEAPNLADKLVLAVGVEAMTSSLPKPALLALYADVDREPDPEEVARLALAVHGYGVLKEHASHLGKNGLNPPSQWAGGRDAREWVRALGFPVEYAGFPGGKRARELEVDGPAVLGKLHDYQAAIGEKIKGILDPQSESPRGLVSLPTGAGKTRVAVQALVERLADTRGDAVVVWVAETDELCEQAVQTWMHVWRAVGTPGERITVSRLWGSNEVEERSGRQIVVASVSKLSKVIQRNDWKSEYGWLVQPLVVVVDEAHRSIGSEYTKILAALGDATRVASSTTPLLGLTATPFRGWNSVETERLVGRYHGKLLDQGVFPGDDVYAHLQELGVLARVRHEVLNGATVSFTDAEMRDAATYNRVPTSVEQRLGQISERNNAIAASLKSLPEGARALVFATSVENARVLAALLTFAGKEARAVSGDTEPAARRRYVEDFKNGTVSVLTNYNVFTEGFDVPSVDAVYITRPTYSPNVYQQMIGRGLRGPLNGGKEEVLVVNVEDNFTNFGEKLAFRHFAHLWKGGAR